MIYWYYMCSAQDQTPDLDSISPDALSQESVDFVLAGMRRNKITQRQLAAELRPRVDESTVSRWFKRKSPMPLRAVRHVAGRIEASVAEVMVGRSLPPPRARVTEVGPAGVTLELVGPLRPSLHGGHAALFDLSSMSPKPLVIVPGVTYDGPNPTARVELVRVVPDAYLHADADVHGGGAQVIDPTQYEYVPVLVTRPSIASLEAARITGRCMEPTIRQGEVVIVDTSRPVPQEGEVVAVILLTNQERMIRRFFFSADGSRVRLVADGDGYAPVEVVRDQVQVIGVVTHYVGEVVRLRPPVRLNGHRGS